MSKKLILILFVVMMLVSGGIYLATEKTAGDEPTLGDPQIDEREEQAFDDLKFLSDHVPTQQTAVPLCPYRRCNNNCNRDTAILAYNDTGLTQCQTLGQGLLTCTGGETVHGIVGNCTPIGQCTPDSWQGGFYCD